MEDVSHHITCCVNKLEEDKQHCVAYTIFFSYNSFSLGSNNLRRHKEAECGLIIHQHERLDCSNEQRYFNINKVIYTPE